MGYTIHWRASWWDQPVRKYATKVCKALWDLNVLTINQSTAPIQPVRFQSQRHWFWSHQQQAPCSAQVCRRTIIAAAVLQVSFAFPDKHEQDLSQSGGIVLDCHTAFGTVCNPTSSLRKLPAYVINSSDLFALQFCHSLPNLGMNGYDFLQTPGKSV